MPQNNYSETCRIFNLREGFFQASVPNHPQYLDPAESRLISELLSSYVPPAASRIPLAERKQLLESILVYYQLHLPGFREVRSHHILHDVLA